MQFLDELALNIDNVVSRNESSVLVGDYNISYFKDVEKQSLETILTSYSLEVQNKETPNRISKKLPEVLLIIWFQTFLWWTVL